MTHGSWCDPPAEARGGARAIAVCGEGVIPVNRVNQVLASTPIPRLCAERKTHGGSAALADS
eukprot:6110708-Prymnesium_polylepis.1